MRTKKYPTDLSDKEWALIQTIVEKRTSPRGRLPKYPKRDVMNAIFYLLRSGCSWRLLPNDFPPWQAVYAQFRLWQKRKIFETINDHVRRELRQFLGRGKNPTAGIVDSQSIKTTEKGGLKALMEEKKSKGENDILQSIPKDFCYRHMLRVPKQATCKD